MEGIVVEVEEGLKVEIGSALTVERPITQWILATSSMDFHLVIKTRTRPIPITPLQMLPMQRVHMTKFLVLLEPLPRDPFHCLPNNIKACSNFFKPNNNLLLLHMLPTVP